MKSTCVLLYLPRYLRQLAATRMQSQQTNFTKKSRASQSTDFTESKPTTCIVLLPSITRLHRSLQPQLHRLPSIKVTINRPLSTTSTNKKSDQEAALYSQPQYHSLSSDFVASFVLRSQSNYHHGLPRANRPQILQNQTITTMKTTYLTTLTTAFNPLSRSSHVPRLFLQLLPVNAHKSIKISQVVLPRSTKSPATLELGFKDGRKMEFSWAEKVKNPIEGKFEKQTQLTDIVEEVERHARILGRKEELQG